MKTSLDTLPLITLVMLAAVVVALLTGAVAALLSRLDGASVPRALLRAGAAFGSCLLVVASLFGVIISTVK
ncbi:hypothetical protein [Streptomyces sp. NPDC058371]|uniref:hypothetical protein n=1 Tax=Streptomyces sp. NPDC058371 TaxID=3346463 RepID=UPI0036643892